MQSLTNDQGFAIQIRYLGLGADDSEIGLAVLGESLSGFARVIGASAHWVLQGQGRQHLDAFDVKVMASPPERGSVAVDTVLRFVDQHQMLQGSIPTIVLAIVTYVIGRGKGKENLEEMKHIEQVAMKAIEALSQRDQDASASMRVLEKLADGLIAQSRRALAPIGDDCRTIELAPPDGDAEVFDVSHKEALERLSAESTVGALETVTVKFTELDLLRKSCKVEIPSHPCKGRVSGTVADPLLEAADNPYSIAFAAQRPIAVVAKLVRNEGLVVRIVVMDVSDEA